MEGRWSRPRKSSSVAAAVAMAAVLRQSAASQDHGAAGACRGRLRGHGAWRKALATRIRNAATGLGAAGNDRNPAARSKSDANSPAVCASCSQAALQQEGPRIAMSGDQGIQALIQHLQEILGRRGGDRCLPGLGDGARQRRQPGSEGGPERGAGCRSGWQPPKPVGRTSSSASSAGTAAGGL